jgi:hypothetical protein
LEPDAGAGDVSPNGDPLSAFLGWRPDGGAGAGRAGAGSAWRTGAASIALTVAVCVVLILAVALPALAGVGPHGWSLGRLVLFCHLG